MEPTFFLKKYFSGTKIPKYEKYHGLVVVPERKDQDVPQSNIWVVKPEIMDLMKRYIDVQVNERLMKKQKRPQAIDQC
jgi:septum formation topological specificity factor MinE